MKRIVILFAVGCLAAAPAVAGDWFDPANCGMCVNMVNEEGLMDHMKWDMAVISNGMLSVTAVDAEYHDAYVRSQKNMEKAGQKMMSGEKLDLCAFCTSFAGLAMAGASMEAVPTEMGDVMLLTSNDPALVKKIHAHAERSIEEYTAMMKAEHGHGHGEGDGHGH